MDWLDDFLGDSKDTIQAGFGILDAGMDLFGGSSSRDRYTDALRDREQYNYDQSKREYDAYVDWASRADAIAAQNAAGAAAAAAARAAAARQQEAARQQALRKSNKVNKRFYKQARGNLEPYAQAGQQILPVATQATQGGLNNLSLLAGYLMQPAQVAKMNPGGPAWEMGFELPSYLTGGK